MNATRKKTTSKTEYRIFSKRLLVGTTCRSLEQAIGMAACYTSEKRTTTEVFEYPARIRHATLRPVGVTGVRIEWK